jgi:RNA polymerase sigma-70 factor, ECF subfamily
VISTEPDRVPDRQVGVMSEADTPIQVTDASGSAETRDSVEDALIQRARRGDGDAFGMLVQPRAEQILRTARAILVNEADAREVTQEAFVSAWINLPGLRDVDRFDAWLNRIVVNRCRDKLRSRRRVREIALESIELPTNDNVASRIERASLLAAFDRLSVADRQIIVLHHLHDLPLSEVARQIGVPIGTAKSRLWSARRALERAMEAEA